MSELLLQLLPDCNQICLGFMQVIGCILCQDKIMKLLCQCSQFIIDNLYIAVDGSYIIIQSL